MTNHYHLVIETPDGNLSRGMRQLNGVYTQMFNRRHSRVGHVFQGRYKAIFVDKDSYLLELSRYVILNPVRAGMVKNPKDWPWSSYGQTVSSDTPSPRWLSRDWLLSQFGKPRKLAIAKYIEFVTDGITGDGIWDELNNQIFLGDEKFVTSIQDKLDSLDKLAEVPKSQRKKKGKPLEYYQTKYKNEKIGMAHAHVDGQYTLKQIGEHYGVHYSTVSRAVKNFLG